MEDKNNVPFTLDFALEVPENVTLESANMSKDSVTYGPGGPKGSDDD